jgi:hypothetical protein
MRALATQALVVGALVGCATPARAEDPGADSDLRLPRLYLRLGLGGGHDRTVRETSARGSVSTPLFLGDSSRIEGASALTELSVGATVLPRFVVAATWLGSALPSPELELVDGGRLPLESAAQAFFLGPTVDVFPHDDGFHFGGGVGYAAYRISAAYPPGAVGGRGAGLTLSVGYDHALDDEWAIGLALRGLLARTLGSHDAGALIGEETATRTVLGLVASVRLR